MGRAADGRNEEAALDEPADPGLVEAELRACGDHASSGIERGVWCLLLGAPEERLDAVGKRFQVRQ